MTPVDTRFYFLNIYMEKVYLYILQCSKEFSCFLHCKPQTSLFSRNLEKQFFGILTKGKLHDFLITKKPQRIMFSDLLYIFIMRQINLVT